MVGNESASKKQGFHFVLSTICINFVPYENQQNLYTNNFRLGVMRYCRCLCGLHKQTQEQRHNSQEACEDI